MKAKNEGHALTSAGEDYLEAIYCVMLEHPGEDSVRSVDVSERLNVTKASVNKALSALKDGGFVDQTRYGRVELTEEGPGGVRIVGQVLNMSADESILGEDGLVDADKAHFLSFDRVRRVYRLLGGVVGQAYQDGKQRMK